MDLRQPTFTKINISLRCLPSRHVIDVAAFCLFYACAFPMFDRVDVGGVDRSAGNQLITADDLKVIQGVLSAARRRRAVKPIV